MNVVPLTPPDVDETIARHPASRLRDRIAAGKSASLAEISDPGTASTVRGLAEHPTEVPDMPDSTHRSRPIKTGAG